MINLLFIPCSIISAVKVLDPVPPCAIDNIPDDILFAFILAVILVAAKVFVSLFHERLGD